LAVSLTGRFVFSLHFDSGFVVAVGFKSWIFSNSVAAARG